MSILSKILTICIALTPYLAVAEESLCLQEAIQRSLAASPILSVSEIDIDIKGDELIQAGLLPNPDFSVT